jgi:hypothetical protein
MPGQTDLYFPPEDSEFEVAHIPNANLVPVPSIWGHFAGGPGAKADITESPSRAISGDSRPCSRPRLLGCL